MKGLLDELVCSFFDPAVAGLKVITFSGFCVTGRAARHGVGLRSSCTRLTAIRYKRSRR